MHIIIFLFVLFSCEEMKITINITLRFEFVYNCKEKWDRVNRQYTSLIIQKYLVVKENEITFLKKKDKQWRSVIVYC